MKQSCPKCGAKVGLYDASGVSIPSSMDRNKEGNAGLVIGDMCAICGYWIYRVEIAMPKVPEVPKPLARPTGPRQGHNSTERSLKLRDRIKEHIEFISDLRRDRISWETISRKLAYERNLIVTDYTLIRHCKVLLSESQTLNCEV